MKKRLLLMSLAMSAEAAFAAGNITLKAVNRPTDKVFEEIVKQSGKNFVYPAGLLDKMKVSVDLKGRSLEEALESLFKGTDISFRIKGNNVTLYKIRRQEHKSESKKTVSGFVREAGSGEALAGAVVRQGTRGASTNAMGFYSFSLPEGKTQLTVSCPGYATATVSPFNLQADRSIDISLTPEGDNLDEVVVHGSKNNTLAMESASVGAINLSDGIIASTPVIFGESDVIKTLQLEPGVSPGVEGMAGMYVHGGNADENLYMLDNIPLYQVNHVLGLFSAFNTEALRNVDFYKSSFPAKFDGRLSSYMDVHTKDGSLEKHHGSARLGLTSGAFNIDGPIWKGHTSYSVALRRSWFDLLSIPACAVYNSISKEEDYNIGLAFTDINAKLNHKFSDRSRAHVMFYYGEDYLHEKTTDDISAYDYTYYIDRHNMRWGNLVVSAGWNYVVSPKIFAEFTAAFSRYKSKLVSSSEDGSKEEDDVNKNFYTFSEIISENFIRDWIFRGDFDWRPRENHTINFVAYYVAHSFLPFLNTRITESESAKELKKENKGNTKQLRIMKFR